jgi:hypothetical protein
MAPGHGDELVEGFGFLGLGRLVVALAERFKEFGARRFAHRGVHRQLPEVGNIPLRQ